MQTIKIPFPDITFFEKTRLANPDADVLTLSKGSSSLYLRNPVGFSANDYMIIEPFESEDAEIVQILTVDRDSHVIDLIGQTYQDHTIGVVVMKIPYNKVKVYKGSSNDVTTHIEVTGSPFDLRPDNAYTYYIDNAGTTSDYYSYTYYNSSSFSVGTQTLYVESDYNAVITVQQLKDWFMFGLDLTDDDGNPFPNSMFEFAIKVAIDNLERILDIKIKPTVIVDERYDYYVQDYKDFAFIQLNQFPVISVQSVKIRYPTSTDDILFDNSWVQLNQRHGQIHLVPTSGTLSQILMGKGGDYLLFVWRGWDFLPNLWKISYTAGFGTGLVPNDLIAIIGRMACFYPLNIAGDLVGGVAIASKSLGIDGLSQSINTTSSPENAGYSARLRQYERELKIEIPRQVAYWKGLRMTVG